MGNVDVNEKSLLDIQKKINDNIKLLEQTIISLDKNCHPFKRKDILMAMNGTQHSVDFISSTKEMTDTEAIIDILDKYNVSSIFFHSFSDISTALSPLLFTFFGFPFYLILI